MTPQFHYYAYHSMVNPGNLRLQTHAPTMQNIPTTLIHTIPSPRIIIQISTSHNDRNIIQFPAMKRQSLHDRSFLLSAVKKLKLIPYMATLHIGPHQRYERV